ncbi:MAG TPA: beta-ketoacyl-ACP synthase 3 [Verrucomicrobiae bacterium]|nr:beta-ketoacyl-ACP synthase 3 [Verrucomicrobiae bacterium]
MANHRPVLGVEVTGWGMALPRSSYTNDELIAQYGLDSDNEWIRTRTGIESRYIAEADETVVTLGAKAGRLALESAGLAPPAAIDYLFLGSTTSPTYSTVPGSHPAIVKQLGEQGYDIQASEETNTACTSFVTALLNSYRQFAVDGIERALVIGADKLSAITEYRDRSTSILFADGAGAVVMEKTERRSGLLGWSQETKGSLDTLLSSPPGGTLQMEGPEVFKHAVSFMVEHARNALQEAETDTDEIALVVPHQANVRIIEAANRRLGIDMDKTAVSIGHFGNTSSASIPLALTEALHAGRLVRGEKALLVGFGAGMTVAAAVIEW